MMMHDANEHVHNKQATQKDKRAGGCARQQINTKLIISLLPSEVLSYHQELTI